MIACARTMRICSSMGFCLYITSLHTHADADAYARCAQNSIHPGKRDSGPDTNYLTSDTCSFAWPEMLPSLFHTQPLEVEKRWYWFDCVALQQTVCVNIAHGPSGCGLSVGCKADICMKCAILYPENGYFVSGKISTRKIIKWATLASCNCSFCCLDRGRH